MSLIGQRFNSIGDNISFAAACMGVILAAVWAYFPGLGGPFVFDDFAALEPLGTSGGVNDWKSFRAYVFGGSAGPTGRPIALVTFLLDASTWPAESWPFKRSNLIIHLINFALLGLLTRKILDILNFERKDANWIALIAAAAWLLHPFLVSTTLYVVQRMAQLSTLFVFAGLLAYIEGRVLLATQARKAYLIMSLSIVVFTLLGVFAKENAILLPLLVGIVEWTIVASQSQKLGALDRKFASLFLIAPSLVIFAYLLQSTLGGSFFDVVTPREFSLYERLLTQPRVLLDYLQHWFVPSLYTTGVFQDHFMPSSSIVSPVSTLISFVVHGVVLAAAVVYRRKWPLFALAILFFYGGHLLESTVLNLELYFEHRNYLPACFLFVPVIVFLRQQVQGRFFAILAVGLLLVLGGFTRYTASVWSELPSMVEASARKAPTSARAQADYAKELFNAGQYEESIRIIDAAISNIPLEKPHLLLIRLTMLCRLDILDETELSKVAPRLSKIAYDPRLISIYYEFLSAVVARQCSAVELPALRTMFVEMLDVEENRRPHSLAYSQILYLTGIIETHDGQPELAVASFEAALDAKPNAYTALNMARLLASKAYFDEALIFSAAALSEVSMGQLDALAGFRISEGDVREFEALVRSDRLSRQTVE